jgi:hypothetical protein
MFRGEIQFGNSALKFKLIEISTKRDLEIKANLAQMFRTDWEEMEEDKISLIINKRSKNDRDISAINVPYIWGQTGLRKTM